MEEEEVVLVVVLMKVVVVLENRDGELVSSSMHSDKSKVLSSVTLSLLESKTATSCCSAVAGVPWLSVRQSQGSGSAAADSKGQPS